MSGCRACPPKREGPALPASLSEVQPPGLCGFAVTQGHPRSRWGKRQINLWAERPFCGFQVGLVYMFNLIVGTGALTMPKAFATAGWLVSLVLLVFLGFMR